MPENRAMMKTFQAVIDEQGHVRLLEKMTSKWILTRRPY